MSLQRQIMLDSPVGYWPLDEPYYALDAFTRADSTTTLGSADSGQKWVPKQGTWGISSNKAYEASPGNGDIVFLDTGKSDFTFECDLLYRDDGDGIVFRALAATVSDGFLVYPDVNTLHCLNPGFASDPPSTPQSRSHSVGTTYHYRVEAYGTSIKVYEDGTLVLNTTSSTNQTATYVGLRSGGTTGTKRWSNLKVYDRTAKDRSGNGRDGIYTNEVTLANTVGRFRAPHFDGSNDYVTIPDSSQVFSGTSFTAELWFNTTTASTASIMAKYNTVSTNTKWNLRQGLTSHKSHFYLDRSGSGAANALSPSNTDDGLWHHLVGTFNGTTAELFVDGASVATNASGSGAFYMATASTSPVSIGSYDGAIEFFTGYVAHAAIYSSLLGADRIKAHFEAGIRVGVSV